MDRRLSAAIAVVALALVGPGCGGGGGGPSGPQTLVVYPTLGLSGNLFEDGAVITDPSATGGVGDTNLDVGVRAVRSFDFSAVPAGAQIQSAVYEDTLEHVAGTPFATLGVVRAVVTDVGTALDGSDYDGPLFAVLLGTLASDPSLGARTLDVTSDLATLADGGGRRVDILIAFDHDCDDDGVTDIVMLRALASGEPRPTLRIVYQTP